MIQLEDYLTIPKLVSKAAILEKKVLAFK